MKDNSASTHRQWLTHFDAIRNELEADSGLHQRLSDIGRIGATSEFDAYRSRVEGLQRIATCEPRSRAASVDEIAPLIVIVGLPRTGTTALQWMLHDSGVGDAPEGWQVYDPSAISGDSMARDHAREAYKQRVEFAALLSKRLMRLHPMSVDTPEECTPVLAASLLTLQTPMMFCVDGLVDRILRADRGWVYDMWAQYVLELSRHGDHARPLVLKSPMHLLGYQEIVRRFPDAVLVQIRRDRREVMTSLLNLVEVTRGIFSDAVNTAALGEEWLAHVKALLAPAEEDARSVDGQLMVIEHDQLCRAPDRVVRAIARRAGLCLQREWSCDQIAAFVRRSHTARLRPLSRYGLSEDQVAKELAPYAEGSLIA